MKIKFLYAVLSLAIIVLITIAAIDSNNVSLGKTNKDIIKFSHAVHKEVTDCATCHDKTAESATLKDRLLPEKAVCATCHDVEDTENCNFCHYENVNEPLIQKESELIFNHKQHVTDQKMECESCHKGLEEAAYSFESASVNPPMSNCYKCHNGETVAANNCETCHISTADLIPVDHQQVNFAKSHKFHAESPKAECEMCHDNNFCETCHVATTMITEKNTETDFITPYSPHSFIDNTKQQNIVRVHDMNYRFSHGIDAKGKTSECQTCHQTETFCAECHNSEGGDFTLEGFVPSSHKSANFVTIGVGSGGGQHAVLAKRDVEQCASCHDVQGADANCIQCHVDNDGVKGTNPKTHERNFLRDNEDGDWHSDENSICYSCHTDANARPSGIRGVGFCGYCHN